MTGQQLDSFPATRYSGHMNDMMNPPDFIARLSAAAQAPVVPVIHGTVKSYIPRAAEPEEEFDRAGERIVARVGHLDVRQAERMPPGYKPRAVGDMTFDPRLAYEIALDIDSPEAMFTRYGYGSDDAVKLLMDAAFVKTVNTYKEEIKTSGIGFKLKAKVQAEDLLTHSYQIATDPETPAAVRADLIKWTAKVAGYEPKEDSAAKGGGGSFALNVTFLGDAPVTLSAGKPVVTIDQEG